MPLDDEEQRAKDALLAQQYIDDYRAAGGMYLMQVEDFLSLPLDRLTSQQKANIFKHADRALAISTMLEGDQHNFELIKCWQMVNLARNIAVADYKKKLRDQKLAQVKAKYLVGLRNIFLEVVPQLPPEMQLLKIFYTLGDYASIEDYLTRFLEVNDEESYKELVEGLSADVTTAATQRASETLEKRNPGFIRLPVAMRNELIAQRAYIIRLHAFLDLSDVSPDDPLRKEIYALSEQLEANIKAALENNRALVYAQADAKSIRADIAKKEDAMMKRIFVQRVQARAPERETVGKAAGASMVAWYLGLVSMPVLAVAATAAAAAVAAASGYEAKETMQGAELGETKLLARELEPVDFMYINKIDSAWQRYTGTPVEKMHITGETIKQAAKRRVGEVIEENIQTPIQEATKPMITGLVSILIALFTITIASLLVSLIVLNILFPPMWPIWVVLGASAVIGFGAWQILSPQSRPANKLMNFASSVTFYVATTLNVLTSPIRGLANNVRQGRVLASIFSLVSGIVFGAVGAVLVPILSPLLLGAGILGAVAGAYLGFSFSQITNQIFFKPVRVIKEYNAASDAVKKEMTLSREQVAKLEQLMPGISKELKDIFQARLAELKNEVAQISIRSNPNDIRNITYKVEDLEDVWAAICNDIEMVIRNDSKESRTLLCYRIDGFLTERFNIERDAYIDKARARKNAHEEVHPGSEEAKAKYVELKRGKMQFSKDKKTTEAKKMVGASPSFNMKFAADYGDERKMLDKLTSLHEKVARIRARAD